MSIFAVRSHLCLFVYLVCAQPASAQWKHLGALTSYDLGDAVLTLHAGVATVRVEAIDQHVIRVRLSPTGRFGRDHSWAVLDATPRGRFVSFEESHDQIRASTAALCVVVDRDPCRLRILDADGRILTADDPAQGMAWRITTTPPTDAARPVLSPMAVRVWQQLPDQAAVYALGEKTGPLDKRGRAWTMWNTDTPAYGGATDPLYKSVPFFISARDGRYHGVFMDNPWWSSFDFGQRDRSVLSFGAEGGELDYYVIAGPGPKDVIRRYTDLTGRMELPPKWAIGYHQCRYSYYPESRVRQIASSFRQKRIPCDVIYFDIDYMDGYRCFTWDKRWFGAPKGLMNDLHEMGFHTVVIIDPGIKHEPGYFVYDQGTKLGAWLTRPNGEVYVGRVWPGTTVFPDFTNPKVRDWWSSLFPPFVQTCGIDGIWNDMNEPADFDGPNHTVPLDLRHDNEGQPASHRACHNVYGMQMARATFEGLRRARPGQRAFTITRATYAGGQRYGAAWTGDNISTWGHLRMSITMVLNLGVSGMPFVGPDIGGFIGGATPELYARWIQVGSLFPFCRTHTCKGNPDQEPWSFGPEVEEVAREALERRYAMLPYLYTLFEESTRTGLPIMRPLWLEFPDARGWWLDEVFMLGSDVYVVPILHPQPRDFFHWLPPGVWFDANTGLIHGAGQPVKIAADLDTLPLFVRAGAIIPMQSPVQSTTHAPDEPLILDVWPFGESTGVVYEDDGQTFAYRRGQFRRTQFRCLARGDSVELTMLAPEGTYVPAERSPLVRFHGLPADIEQVTCVVGDGEATVTRHQATDRSSVPSAGDFTYEARRRTWLVRMHPDNGEAQQLQVKLAPLLPADDVSASVDFADSTSSIAYHHDLMKPISVNGTTQLRVRGTGDPYIVLRRLRFSARNRPLLKIRLSTEHTTKLGLRFATQQDPLLSARALVAFDIVADGRPHEYTVDLSRASKGDWAGTVYWVRLDFEEGRREGELITLDHVAFEGRTDASGPGAAG